MKYDKPGGSATRPGDVVTSMSGQTIEILSGAPTSVDE